MKKLSLAVRSVGQMIILRENGSTPDDKDWDGFLEVLIKNRDNFEKMKCLVVTDGGGPNAPQRKRLEAALARRPLRVAVVTDSSKARFIASMITFLNSDHRGFSNKEIGEAYVHLGMNREEQLRAAEILRELEPLVG
jgi:hypothetical protein